MTAQLLLTLGAALSWPELEGATACSHFVLCVAVGEVKCLLIQACLALRHKHAVFPDLITGCLGSGCKVSLFQDPSAFSSPSLGSPCTIFSQLMMPPLPSVLALASPADIHAGNFLVFPGLCCNPDLYILHL